MLLAWSPRAHALDPSLDISQYAHTSWRVRDGAFAGSINAITQTPDGYLWLGTEFGLVRFDGVRSVPWPIPAEHALPAGPIVKLLTTRDGTLWIGGQPGLASLKAGNYVALDVSGNGRPPLVPFTIAKAAHPASLPRPAATIAAIEFGFRGPGRLHRGDLVRFANHGFLVHMIVFATASSHRQARKVARLLKEGKPGKAFRHSTGGGTFAGPISHGAYQQLVVRHRGWYVLACFMDTQDGREHTRLGMERVIHVK